MAGLSDSFLQELKMRSDVEDIVSSYVTLKKRGNTFVGLCPFHNEVLLFGQAALLRRYNRGFQFSL